MTYEASDFGGEMSLNGDRGFGESSDDAAIESDAGYDRIMRARASLDGVTFGDDQPWMARVTLCSRLLERCMAEAQRDYSFGMTKVHEYGYGLAREQLYAATEWMLAGADREDRLDDPNTMALVVRLKDHVPSRAVDQMATRTTIRLLERTHALLRAGDEQGVEALVDRHRQNTSLRKCADMTMATADGRDRSISELLVNCAASPFATRALLESIVVPVLAPDPEIGRRQFGLLQTVEENDLDDTFVAGAKALLDLVGDDGALRLDYRDVDRAFVAIEDLLVARPRDKSAPVTGVMIWKLFHTAKALLADTTDVTGLRNPSVAAAWGSLLGATIARSDACGALATEYGVDTMRYYVAALKDDLCGQLAGAGAFLSAFRQPLIGSRNTEWLQVHSEMVRTLVGQGVGLDTSLMVTLCANVVASQSIYKDRDLVRFSASKVKLTTDLDDGRELLTVNRAESVAQLAVALSAFDSSASLDLLARAVIELEPDEVVTLIAGLNNIEDKVGPGAYGRLLANPDAYEPHRVGRLVAERVSDPWTIGRAYRVSVDLDFVNDTRTLQVLEFKEQLYRMSLLDATTALAAFVDDLSPGLSTSRLLESQAWLALLETWAGEPGSDDPRNDVVLAAHSLTSRLNGKYENASLALLCLERAGVLGRPEADWIALRSLDYLGDDVVEMVCGAYRVQGREDVAIRAIFDRLKLKSRSGYFIERSMLKVCADFLSTQLTRPTVESTCQQAWYYLASTNDRVVSNFVTESQIHDDAALLGQGLLGFTDLGDELHNTGSVELRDEIAELVSMALFASPLNEYHSLASQLQGRIALYKSRQVPNR